MTTLRPRIVGGHPVCPTKPFELSLFTTFRRCYIITDGQVCEMVVNFGSGRLLQRLRIVGEPLKVLHARYASTSTSRRAEAVFVEKLLERPIIAITDRDNVDMIGPPDKVSNLRPIVRRHCLHETELQQKLRLLQDETHAWNQKFWAEHNNRFIKERQEYVKLYHSRMGADYAITADEMSGFYKKFLDDNWKMHVRYNLQWYKRNFAVLFLALRASLPQSLHFVSSRN